jgi:hypothetical protein
MAEVSQDSLQYACCKVLADSIYSSRKGTADLVRLRIFRQAFSYANAPSHLVATVLELLVEHLDRGTAQRYELTPAEVELWAEVLHSSCLLNGLALSLRAISYVAPAKQQGFA